MRAALSTREALKLSLPRTPTLNLETVRLKKGLLRLVMLAFVSRRPRKQTFHVETGRLQISQLKLLIFHLWEYRTIYARNDSNHIIYFLDERIADLRTQSIN